MISVVTGGDPTPTKDWEEENPVKGADLIVPGLNQLQGKA